MSFDFFVTQKVDLHNKKSRTCTLYPQDCTHEVLCISFIVVTSHGKTYTNVLTFNGLKRQLAVSHRQSAVSNPLVNFRRFHQTVRRFCQTVRRIHQTVRRIQQTVSSTEKALVVTL